MPRHLHLRVAAFLAGQGLFALAWFVRPGPAVDLCVLGWLGSVAWLLGAASPVRESERGC